MTSMSKPFIDKHLPKNKLGLSVRNYEGVMSTLCAGCGHDSVTAALVQAFWELDLAPESAAKVSGIGCSSKTTAYFMGQSHGINCVHGRMPSVATGANAANGDLNYIGISGDGDSLSIGFGQFAHSIRRNLNMLYILENNGVYGLTKGQFSAAADYGSKSKKGIENDQMPIDPCVQALTLGAGFVARAFSGDKTQLVPLIKAGLKHKGFALIDVISPCVTFNDHAGSTKSYAHTYKYYHPLVHTDFVAHADEVTGAYDQDGAMRVTMQDGGELFLRKTESDYDPRDRAQAIETLLMNKTEGEIRTGLLYLNSDLPDMQAANKLPKIPLNQVPYESLTPGKAALAKLQARYR
ncbi:2-oxoacid:ferredoxin oxidoreductase subunit beta [Maricaulis sp.]|jgi:2-oxoglutarate/2-oxoacid ferredoxin oxidoreductase subunit beta|uniref:2-oxoacid:ferredoxin oxidoreductase subunit beta n=1 Tax=Maricaulis sp. TaxID=1486257 RepID=UPI002630E639|nr:2-oxoacid:ferredoxin oxidoreductase subunit beta [Maricaulis sp.]MDF1770144.1 2-oxoacid:ferredoxin oxidoreductase subunit beta [Maricaulis sp.]